MKGRPGTQADGSWQWGVLRNGSPAAAVVVKFGGSLLARADWSDLLRSLADSFEGLPVSVIVGGGATVDSIRRIDAAARLDAAVSHRLAIDAMGITARLVSDATGWPLAAVVPQPGSPRVVDVPAWLDAGGRLARLPAGWHVTSDSIAAFVAAETGSELLLAKSVPPPDDAAAGSVETGCEEAGHLENWVDAWFATAAAGVGRIAWAAPVSPTTRQRPAGRRARRPAASPPRDSRPSSRRPPTAERARHRRR